MIPLPVRSKNMTGWATTVDCAPGTRMETVNSRTMTKSRAEAKPLTCAFPVQSGLTV